MLYANDYASPLNVWEKRAILNIIEEMLSEGKDIIAIHYTGDENDTDGQKVRWYHRFVKKWSRAGYHRFVNSDGLIDFVESIYYAVNGMLWDQWGRNTGIIKRSLQICFETTNKNLQLSPKQEAILLFLCKSAITMIPGVLIGGHREFPYQATQCPGFDVEAWLRKNGIPDKNNYYFSKVRGAA